MFLLLIITFLCLCRTKWGVFLRYPQYSVLDNRSLTYCRMGKTIQTLALLVTDGTGPNLVVAYVTLLFPNRIFVTYNVPQPNCCNYAVEEWNRKVHGRSKSYDMARVISWGQSQWIEEIWRCKLCWKFLVCPDNKLRTGQVLTTYAVLESAFRRQERGFKRKGGNALVTQPSIVHQIVWHRIIVSPHLFSRDTHLRGVNQLK